VTGSSQWRYSSTFLDLGTLLKKSGQCHAPAALPLGERATGTHWIGRWVDPRTGLDELGEIKTLPVPGIKLRPLGRPDRSQSLYRLTATTKSSPVFNEDVRGRRGTAPNTNLYTNETERLALRTDRCVGYWVGPTAGLEAADKRKFSCPQSVHKAGLHYAHSTLRY
jgi:hypothetical protein